MNTIAEQLKTTPQQVFDRLVDGELPDQQRRDLLALLDDEPGAWRTCALAFLEAQSWRQDCSAVQQELLARGPRHSVAVKPESKWQLPRSTAGMGPLPLAACVLLSLVIGWQLAVQFGSLARPGELALAPQQHSDGQVGRRNSPPLSASPTAGHDIPASEDNAVQTVQLNIADPRQGVSEAIDLPVVEKEEFDAQWLAEQPSAVPPQLLEKLEKLGHRVTQNSQLWPIRLHDGRELLVPVEQLEVQFAKSYQ